MKTIDTIVLGSSTSALPCLVVNQEAIAFGRSGGGNIKDMDFTFGPMFLHSTRHTREFYREFLDINPESLESEINFRYVYGGDIHKSLDKETKQTYYEKSRGTSEMKEEDTVASEEKTSFNSIEPLNKYAERLYNRVEDRIHESEDGVTNINLEQRTVTFKGEKYRFNNLVSTIPAPIFKGLVEDSEKYNFSENYESTGTTFYVLDNPRVDIREEYLDEISDLDYIYFPTEDIYRATVFKNGMTNTWTLEVNEENDILEEGDVVTVGASSGVITIKGNIKTKIPIPAAKTLNEVDTPNIGGVFFAGRFARWSHSIKTDDVIRRLMIGDLPIAKGNGDLNGQ